MLKKMCILACLILILPLRLSADTILLSDGTYLTGKVVKWDAYHIIFKNAHGAFAIKKKQLVKLYVTGSHLEDIELNKKLGSIMKDEDVVRHYLAGMEGMPPGGIDRKRLEKEIKTADLNGRIRIYGTFYHVMGRISDAVPSAWGLSLGYSQSISGFLPEGSALWAPLLYAEGEAVSFSGDEAEMNDFSFYAGPRWEFLVPAGTGFLHLLPGYSYLDIESEDYETRSSTVSVKLQCGYEYSAGSFSVLAALSYLYIYDRSVFAHGAGLSLGAIYKF